MVFLWHILTDIDTNNNYATRFRCLIIHARRSQPRDAFKTSRSLDCEFMSYKEVNVSSNGHLQ